MPLGTSRAPVRPFAEFSSWGPGHSLIVENENVRDERYWELPFPEEPAKPLSEREYADRLVEELDEAVKLRLMSDVPLGAMLSGGLDSSVVVALMARHSTRPVKTFSVAFAEDVQGNELADARLVAETFGTEHHELELSLRETSIPLEELVWYLDEPLADLSALGLYALSELAARDVTVALSGQGADELLGGYPTHRNAALADTWARLPGPLRKAGAPIANHAPSRYRRAARAVTAGDPVARFVAQSERAGIALGLSPQGNGSAVDAPGSPSEVAKRYLDGHQGTALQSTLFLHQQLGLVDDMLHYFDRASMARSLEVRVPFLDHHVVEFCAGLPGRLKVRRGEGKHLLRVAARDLIPQRIVDKRKVGFFSHAVGAWFQEQAGGVVKDYLGQPDPAYAAFVDPGLIDRLMTTSSTGADGKVDSLLLRVLMLEVWLKTFLPRALETPRPTLSRPLSA